MAKPTPPRGPGGGPKGSGGGGSRRDKLASFEAARKRDQRNRTIRLLVICVVAAAAVLAVPLYLYFQDARARGAVLAEIGPAANAAGCDAPSEEPATGNQNHVPDGSPITYAQHPPASGPHYTDPAPFVKHFYRADDRPEVGNIVHNLEHGYTVAWYRPSAPADQIANLEAIAKTFSADAYDPTKKFIAAPWVDSDPAGFPEGKNMVLARWTADPNAPSNPATQMGVRQACAAVSGPAVADFMAKYPYENSPEANGA